MNNNKIKDDIWETDLNDKRTKRKKIITVSRKLFIVLVLLLLLCSALFGYSFYKLYQSYENSQAKVSSLNSEIETMIEENVIINSDEFKNNATSYGAMVRFAQHYFPDHFVYTGYGGIKFMEINQDLELNQYPDSSKIRVIDGYQYYIDEEKGFKSSLGLDVSVHQGDIEWEKVGKTPIEWVMIRVGNRGYSTGEIKLDEKYEENIEGAKSVNLPVGVYFYSAATNVAEAQEEAKFVLENIKDKDISLPIAFDMEDVGGSKSRTYTLSVDEKTAIAKSFCDTMKENNYQCLIYGNSKWLMERLNFEEVADYGIWHAQYSYYNFAYKLDMFQYTSSGKVDGISGKVDLNMGFFE